MKADANVELYCMHEKRRRLAAILVALTASETSAHLFSEAQGWGSMRKAVFALGLGLDAASWGASL